MYDKILFSLVLSVVSTKLAETFKSDRKLYLIDFSKIKICRPTGIHIGAQRNRRNVACTELLLSQYLLKSHVKIILNIIRISKTQIASLSGHLPSYLFIFLTNFWVYHFSQNFSVFHGSRTNAFKLMFFHAVVQEPFQIDLGLIWGNSFFHENFHQKCPQNKNHNV